MSKPDDIKRWLDNGWYFMMWRNPMGSYTGILVRREEINSKPPDEPIIDVEDYRITDDFEPTALMARLAEKLLGNVIDERK